MIILCLNFFDGQLDKELVRNFHYDFLQMAFADAKFPVSVEIGKLSRTDVEYCNAQGLTTIICLRYNVMILPSIVRISTESTRETVIYLLASFHTARGVPKCRRHS